MSKGKRLTLVTAHGDLAPALPTGDRLVLFTHVPKAAGTTLDHIIGAVATLTGRKRLRAMGTIYGQFLGLDKSEAAASLAALPAESLGACGYLTGHLPYGVHESLPRPCLYVTLLRDPLARLRSQFRFGLERQGWLPTADIDELIADGRIAANGQTRQIAGLADAGAPCTEATLATAIDNLRRRYAVVGIAERFDEALRALIALFGWPGIAYMEKQQGSAFLDAAMEARIKPAAERHFALDRALYAEAAARTRPWADGLLVPAPGLSRERRGVLAVTDRGAEFFPGETFAAARTELMRHGYEVQDA
jgi:hypothetical protein